MVLSKILQGVTVSKMFQTLYGRMVVTHDVEVRNIQYDSRLVQPGDMFVAIRGTASDGHHYIQNAVSNGAKVVVVEDDNILPDSFFMHAGVVKIVVPDSRSALAKASSNYYGDPSEQLTMVGVTGTNGKTTTTHVLKSVLEGAGKKCGLIGTIEYKIGNMVIPATHTTPESLELNELLRRMVREDCHAAVMEVSSHALHQHRVDGIAFDAAVFTNLTQDHLDYHNTMEDYFEAKRMLFVNLAPSASAIVNIDDPWGHRMLEATHARKISYGISHIADVRAEAINLSMEGIQFSIVHNGETTIIKSSLVGRFNVSNILAGFATGIALGIPKQSIQTAINSMSPVRGRFEPILSPRGWTAIVDYAHTPDALEKALASVRDIVSTAGRGRVITVFGCGGNRDRTKRPRMAAAATTQSDITYITSDNPRTEDPERIIDEIMAGVTPGATTRREVDRKIAIMNALGEATSGDLVLIAGKGHEDYQILGDRKVHFSDREIVEEFIRQNS